MTERRKTSFDGMRRFTIVLQRTTTPNVVKFFRFKTITTVSELCSVIWKRFLRQTKPYLANKTLHRTPGRGWGNSAVWFRVRLNLSFRCRNDIKTDFSKSNACDILIARLAKRGLKDAVTGVFWMISDVQITPTNHRSANVQISVTYLYPTRKGI